MAKTRIIIFDVDHGFAGFVKDSSGNSLSIDCGGKDKFSPAKRIKAYELNGNNLTKLVITHPHVDHLSDIENFVLNTKPRIIFRNKISDFPTDSLDHSNEAIKKYKEHLDEAYTEPVKIQPSWAIQKKYFLHDPDIALSIDESKVINNSSIVTIIEYAGRKIIFAGDIEELGWKKHLEKQEFRESIDNCDIFVTSHHGHTSGFCAELYKYMGKPLINIASVKSLDESVDSRYSSNEFAIGYPVVVNNQNQQTVQTRKLITTRQDGSVFIEIDENGDMAIATYYLDDNL